MPDLNEMKEIDEVEFDVYDSDTGKDLIGFGADSANNLKVRDLWNEYPDRADNGIFALTPLDEEKSNAVVQAVKDFSAGFAGNVSQGVLTLPKNMEATGLGLLEETTKAITPMVDNSPIWKTVSKEIFDIDTNSKEYKETVDTFNKVFSEKIKEEQHNLYLQNQEISKDINEAFGLTGEGFFEKLGGATGSLFTAIGMNFIGGTPAVLGYFGASSGTDAFQTAREKGKSNWEALGRGLMVGSWEAFSEKIGLDLFIGGLAKKGAKAFLFGMVNEGTQEAVQNIGSDFLMKDITGKKWSEILYDASESGFYAMLTGGLLGGIGRIREGKVRETIKQGYIKAGLSDEQATKFTDKLIEYGSNNENMTDLMKETINEQLDHDKYPSGDHKEAVKRAVEYKDRYLAENQYDYDIRDRVKENITGLDEKNKNQVADFVQSFADSTYEDFGITPVQMLEDTGLKVQNESLNLADENTYFNANGELVDKATGQVLFQKEQYNKPTININGVEKSALNSEGKPLGRTEEEIRNFYKWFGDSKVVDANGNPMVVYHGTEAEFNEFKKSDRGIYFATPQRKGSVSSYYAGDNGKILDVYLSMKNPFIGTPSQKNISEIKKQGYDGMISVADENLGESKYFNYETQQLETENLQKGDIIEIVAFEPNQIKSVDNKGTYSSDTGNIYLQEGEQNIRGMFDMTKASERIVSVMKSGDVDTMMHELSHFFTTYRIELAIKNNKLDLLEPLFKEYNLEVNVENAKRLQTEFQEDIATKAVNYFLDGKAPTVGLRKYFSQMKKWAMNMWDSLVDKGLVNREEISENMQDFFDGMFGTRAMALDLQGIRQNKSGIKKLLNDIKNGREINFNSEEYGNINIDEVYNLIKTKNARIPKMPKNLKQALISAGGIDINLANNLDLINLMGMQDEKNQKLFVKNGAIKDETQLIEWLKSNGFMAQKESLSYDDTANDQDMALNLLENSDNVYSENDAAQLTYRERVLEAAEEAEKILDGLDYYEAVQALSELKGKNQTVIDKMASKKLAGKLKEFEKQYKKYAKDLATATKSEIQGIRNNIVDFINSQNIDGNDKAKLLSEIKKANSPLTLQKTMERVKQRAETYYTQEQVRLLSAIVDKEIKKSRPVDAKHQRYDYENNKLFQALREDSKLTQKEAEIKWNDLMSEEGEISKSKEIEKLYLAYQMNGAKTSPQLLNMLVDKIQEAKQAGRMAKDELDFERKLNIKQNKEEVLAGIKSRKVANKFTVGISRGIDNLYSMLNLVAGKNTADKFQMETTEEKMAIHKNKILNSSLDTARKIYGLKTKGEFLNKVGELRTVIGQLYTREDSNVGKLSYDITKMHIIDLYNAAQNSKSLNDLEYYYGKEQLQGLFSLLTTQDIQFAESMRETVDGLYPEINEVYIQQYGTDLNRVENYWMASTEHKKEAELLSSFTKAKNTPSFYEKRTNTRTLIVPTDAYSKFNRHITGACYMIDMARPWKSLRDTFNSVRVKNAIQNKFGKGAWNNLDKHINDLSFGEMMRGVQSDEISSILNTMQNNFVTAKIAIAPSVFVKQLTSVTNYAENMGYGKWGIDFVKGLSHPKETLDYMNKYVGDFLKNRFQTGYDEAMKRVLQEAKQKRYQVLTDGAKNNYTEFLSLFTRSGDLMAIAYGGYPRLKQLVDSGMPIEKVREQFMLETLQGQQSGNTSSLSNMQKNRSVFLRIMYSFKNTPMQYARKINDSIISCLNGDISVKEASRKLFNYAVIQPTLYVLVGNMIYNLFSPDDKDKELTDGILQEMAMQFVNPIPLLDKLVDYGFKKMAGKYTDTQLMIYSDFKKAIDKMGKKQKNTYDYLEILVPFIEGFTALPAGRAVKNLKTLAE